MNVAHQFIGDVIVFLLVMEVYELELSADPVDMFAVNTARSAVVCFRASKVPARKFPSPWRRR